MGIDEDPPSNLEYLFNLRFVGMQTRKDVWIIQATECKLHII